MPDFNGQFQNGCLKSMISPEMCYLTCFFSNVEENVQNFTILANISGAHVLFCKKTHAIGIICFRDTP